MFFVVFVFDLFSVQHSINGLKSQGVADSGGMKKGRHCVGAPLCGFRDRVSGRKVPLSWSSLRCSQPYVCSPSEPEKDPCGSDCSST